MVMDRLFEDALEEFRAVYLSKKLEDGWHYLYRGNGYGPFPSYEKAQQHWRLREGRCENWIFVANNLIGCWLTWDSCLVRGDPARRYMIL